MTYRFAFRGIGVYLAAIQADVPQLQQPHRLRYQQDLHEQLLDFGQESLTKRRNRIVVGVHVSADETERDEFIGGSFNLTRTKNARRVAVEQQAQHDFRRIGWRTFIFVLLINLAQVKLANQVYRESSQMLWRQDISQADLEIERLFIIGGSEFSGHAVSLHCIRWRRQGSPTNC